MVSAGKEKKGGEAVQVVTRVRPMSQRELDGGKSLRLTAARSLTDELWHYRPFELLDVQLWLESDRHHKPRPAKQHSKNLHFRCCIRRGRPLTDCLWRSSVPSSWVHAWRLQLYYLCVWSDGLWKDAHYDGSAYRAVIARNHSKLLWAHFRVSEWNQRAGCGDQVPRSM